MVTRYDVRLLHKKEVAEHTLEFTLEKPQGFEYRAGQFGDIVLPASTGLDESHNKHGFSFASAPFEDTLRMATLMRPSKFKQAAAQVPDGTVVGLLALWAASRCTRTPTSPRCSSPAASASLPCAASSRRPRTSRRATTSR